MCLPGTVETVRTALDADPAAGRAHAPAPVSRRALLAGGGALALGGALAPSAAWAKKPRGRGSQRVQDLTHVFRAGFPVYTGDAPARRTLVTVADDGFYAQAWSFGEHSGTHLDAPGHFVADGRRTPQLRAAELVAPIVVIDISARARRDADAAVEAADVRAFERRHGRIPRGALVCMHSGWEDRADDPEAYRNAGADGRFHFPGFALEAVELLLRRRAIRAIGVDTLSLDVGESSTFEVHKRLLGADRYGIENVANLERIPARGATAIVGVVPWEQGSGGPCRLLATY